MWGGWQGSRQLGSEGMRHWPAGHAGGVVPWETAEDIGPPPLKGQEPLGQQPEGGCGPWREKWPPGAACGPGHHEELPSVARSLSAKDFWGLFWKEGGAE